MTEEFEHPDDKTLRLAVPVVTAERIDKLIRYQRTWLEGLKRRGAHESAAMAEAHREALTQAGLTAREAGELEALARDYCGKRWTMRQLARRHAEGRARLEASRAKGEPEDPEEREKVDRLATELRTKDVLPALESRYGREAIAQLQEREDELLDLHQAVGAALRPGAAR